MQTGHCIFFKKPISECKYLEPSRVCFSELEERYEGKLQKEMNGPEYEIVSKVFKAVTTRKITVPGSFLGYDSMWLNTYGIVTGGTKGSHVYIIKS